MNKFEQKILGNIIFQNLEKWLDIYVSLICTVELTVFRFVYADIGFFSFISLKWMWILWSLYQPSIIFIQNIPFAARNNNRKSSHLHPLFYRISLLILSANIPKSVILFSIHVFHCSIIKWMNIERWNVVVCLKKQLIFYGLSLSWHNTCSDNQRK